MLAALFFLLHTGLQVMADLLELLFLGREPGAQFLGLGAQLGLGLQLFLELQLLCQELHGASRVGTVTPALPSIGGTQHNRRHQGRGLESSTHWTPYPLGVFPRAITAVGSALELVPKKHVLEDREKVQQLGYRPEYTSDPSFLPISSNAGYSPGAEVAPYSQDLAGLNPN